MFAQRLSRNVTALSMLLPFSLLLLSTGMTTFAIVDFDKVRQLAPEVIAKVLEEDSQGLQERQVMSSICARITPLVDLAARRHHAIQAPSEQSLRNAKLARSIERSTFSLAARSGADFNDVSRFPDQIDVRQTAIGQQCPDNFQLSRINCTEHNLNIRAIDGTCTNLRHPLWGVAGTAFSRLMGANYEDGISKPRQTSKATTDSDAKLLPLARHISTCLSPMFIKAHRTATIAFVFFGQIVDHDLGLAPMARIEDPERGKIPPPCCNLPSECKHPECFELHLPADDERYARVGKKCMEFVRTIPALRESCRLGYREQVNEPTHWLDASFNYASTVERQRIARAFVDGLLATSQSPTALAANMELSPSRTDDFECESTPDKHCFFGGDPRINENVILTSLHQVYLREHNRLARAFKQIAQRTGRSTTDEDLYQAARKIVMAEVQHSIYNEFLPVLLGNSIMSDAKNELELCGGGSNHRGQQRPTRSYCNSAGYYTGYDDRVPPHISHEFSTAAFRMGHTLLPEFFYRTFLEESFNVEQRLADHFFEPGQIFERGAVAGILYGAMIKNAETYDSTIVRSVRDDLFKERRGSKGIGMDLFALNIQRSRDHGLNFYNDYRELCGLGRAATFADLADTMDAKSIERLKCAYTDVNDVELFAGGVSETPLNNNDGVVGPTFACIIAQQFHQLKKADRFWYENPLQFTPQQLQEIRKFKISRMFCDNSEITRAQPFLLIQPTPMLNAERPCSELESMNLDILAEILPPAES